MNEPLTLSYVYIAQSMQYKSRQNVSNGGGDKVQ